MADESQPNGTPPKPGVLTFRFDPETGSIAWTQEGAFPLGQLVNALEVCKAVQVQRQLNEHMARTLAEQAQKIQPAQAFPRPGGLLRP